MGQLFVGTDPGWQLARENHCVFLYKGYAESAPLSTLLWQIYQEPQPKLLGNFCVLVLDTSNNVISIKTDRYRSFPIYVDLSHSVGNLRARPHVAWTDSLLVVHPDLSVTETKFDVIGDLGSGHGSIDWIDQRLRTRIQSVLKQAPGPLRVFLSGGVDTLLTYSYLVNLGADFDLIKALHVDFDQFWMDNSDAIQKNWAYHQIHHWNDPCWLMSGAPGDEYMLRSPVTANLFLMRHGTSIPQQVNLAPDCLHREYFRLPKHMEIFQQQQDLVDDRQLCNIVVNDWQHWHLGHTLTWTPLRDLEIFKACLQLPYETALGQILNSDVSCALMDRNVPGLSNCISDQKNHGNVFANLKALVLNHA